MCNLSQGVQEYGMELGKVEGRVEGRAETNKKTAIKLYKKQQSVDEIADLLDVSIEEVEDWLGLVKA